MISWAFEPGPRPNFNFPGAWLYTGGQSILHVIGGRPKSELKPGVIDHMAFSGQDLAATLSVLKTRKVAYECRQQAGTGLWQVFFSTPMAPRSSSISRQRGASRVDALGARDARIIWSSPPTRSGNGDDYLESMLGVRPQRGGKHAAMGTHNSRLLKLGERCFLEVIAIDPDAAAPARPRWFDLDRPAMRALLAQQPRLIHWVARTDDIETARRAKSDRSRPGPCWCRAAASAGASPYPTTAAGPARACCRR